MPNKRPTGNLKRDIEELFDEINLLTKSVNQPQKVGSARNEGKDGDVRFVEREDGNAYFMMCGRRGWYTTVADIIQQAGNNLPRPHFKYLSVDNLFAKMFTINQTNAYNGNWLMSSGVAVVENVTEGTITFKDQTGLNVCPFMVNDKCEIRQVAADKSLTIKLSQFTVTAVSGRTIAVTYESGHPAASVGDIVVQRGSSSETARQNAIYFSINDADSPHIGLYTGLTGFTLGTPTVAIGDLSGITDTDFSPDPLVGQGLYATGNVYMKGTFLITNPEDIDTSGLTNDAGWTDGATWGVNLDSIPTRFTDALPASGSGLILTASAMGYYTDAGGSVQLKTYMANNGDFFLAGTTASLTWDASEDTLDIEGGTFTGGTVQTAASGSRVVLNSDFGNRYISLTNTSGDAIGGLMLNPFATDGIRLQSNGGMYIDVTSGSASMVASDFYFSHGGNVNFGYEKYIINASGQLTKVNNLAASSYTGYGLVSDGTSYTPTAMAISNWNTAYGWGDHSSAGYMANDAGENYAEDPVTIGGISINTAFISIGGVGITVLVP